MMKIVSIGADPEFFIRDRMGRPYPATPFAEGTKDNPKQIVSLGEGFYEQRDNISFEGNIPPAYNKEEFVRNVTLLREYFNQKVNKFGFSVSPNGVEYFPKRMLRSAEALEFGCSTVISAWASLSSSYHGSLYYNMSTPVLAAVDFRVAGFHIHIGMDSIPVSHKQMCILVGRLFDLFLTIPSRVVCNEPERLLTYGKYGMIREKIYSPFPHGISGIPGVECRTLSTFFTQQTWLPWVYDQIMKIERFINMCSESELIAVTRNSHPTFDERMSDVFKDIFHDFINKDILQEFDEIKNIINNKPYVFNNSDVRDPVAAAAISA